jgi:RNA polymerase sigma-70 factor (ECF subfamily)
MLDGTVFRAPKSLTIAMSPFSKRDTPSLTEREALQNEEAVLIKRTTAGDTTAFRSLVEKYQTRMFGHAFGIVKSKEDAEDVVQEAMVKAYLALPKFEGKAAFSTWLKKIVVNFAIDWKRRNNRRGGTHEELDEKIISDGDERFNPSTTFFRKEESKRINKVLSQISEEHREVVILREIDGLSYEEIARTIGISVGTVMSRLHYARKKLQLGLQETEDKTGAASAESGKLAGRR